MPRIRLTKSASRRPWNGEREWVSMRLPAARRVGNLVPLDGGRLGGGVLVAGFRVISGKPMISIATMGSGNLGKVLRRLVHGWISMKGRRLGVGVGTRSAYLGGERLKLRA
jgi:hypothetical protein